MDYENSNSKISIASVDDDLKRTGCVLWASCLVLGRWLVDLNIEDKSRFCGKNVVELGAGRGFPEIVCQ